MAFELFTETGTRTKEFISITETKTFGLSRAFLDKYGVTSDHKAVILYDKDANQIALHFSLNDPKFGFAIRVPNDKHGANIIARSFFDIKGIDAKRYAGRYDDFKIVKLSELAQPKEGKAYLISLKQKKTPNTQDDSVVIDDIADEPISLDDILF